MTPIKWELTHSPTATPGWSWHLVGRWSDDGVLWAHYLFAVRPTRRIIRKTKRGTMAANLLLCNFLEDVTP